MLEADRPRRGRPGSASRCSPPTTASTATRSGRARRSSRPSSAMAVHLGRRTCVERAPGSTAVEVVRDRHPLDLLPGAVHRPRPALGPGRRDVRRGPAPHRRARRGDDPRLPGRRADRPDRDPGLRQALRRLLRDAGRPGRQRGRPQPAQAARRGSCRRSSGRCARAAARSCSATSRSTACRSPPTGGCSTTCSSGEWGFTGTLVTDWDNVGRMVWEQKVCADDVEAATVAVRAGNDLVMTTPQLLRGRPGGGRARACSTRRRSTRRSAGSCASSSSSACSRTRAPRTRPGRPPSSAAADARRPQPRGGPPVPGAAAQRRHPAARTAA